MQVSMCTEVKYVFIFIEQPVRKLTMRCAHLANTTPWSSHINLTRNPNHRTLGSRRTLICSPRASVARGRTRAAVPS
jgi:hypothetical protein